MLLSDAVFRRYIRLLALFTKAFAAVFSTLSCIVMIVGAKRALAGGEYWALIFGFLFVILGAFTYKFTDRIWSGIAKLARPTAYEEAEADVSD
jgi:hypothetical protein